MGCEYVENGDVEGTELSTSSFVIFHIFITHVTLFYYVLHITPFCSYYSRGVNQSEQEDKHASGRHLLICHFPHIHNSYYSVLFHFTHITLYYSILLILLKKTSTQVGGTYSVVHFSHIHNSYYSVLFHFTYITLGV